MADSGQPPAAAGEGDPRIISAAALYDALSGSAQTLCDLLSAQTPSAPQADRELVSGVIQKIVKGIQTGEDFSDAYPTIKRLISNQEQRANIVSQLMVFDDYRRVSEMLSVRNDIEADLLLAAKNGKLHPAERIVMLDMLDKRIKGIEAKIAGSATNIQDVVGLLQKANYAIEAQGEALRTKFAQSSPQGREIIRKLLVKMSRELDQEEKE